VVTIDDEDSKMSKIQRLKQDLLPVEDEHRCQTAIGQNFSITIIIIAIVVVMLMGCVASLSFVLFDCVYDTHPTSHGLYPVIAVLPAAQSIYST